MERISTKIDLGKWIEEEQCPSSQKLELSAKQFISAITTGVAVDNSGNEKNFHVLEHSNHPDSYVLENITVSEPIEFEQLAFPKMIVIKCSNLKSISIKKCSFEKKVILSKTKIEESFFIYDTAFSEGLSLARTIVQNTFESNRSQIKTLEFTKSCSCKEIGIYGGEYFEIEFPPIPKEGKLLVYTISFVKLTFVEISNLGYIHLNELTAKQGAVISIQNSSMGIWEVVSCNFSKTEFWIFSSKITDGFYTNSVFPKKLASGITKEEHSDFRDAYNQLKAIASKQSDRKHFLQFQAAELRSYDASLNWFKDFPTKFQLKAMWLSNDYGGNWVRGILFILMFNLLFIALIRHHLFVQIFSNNNSNQIMSPKTLSYIGKYYEFLFSITTKPDWIQQGFETIVFYISRIFIAFGIYQMVAAFRKFGKAE